MYAVVAVYPSGRRVLVGFGHDQDDVDGLISDVCATNGGAEAIATRGIRFNIELAG